MDFKKAESRHGAGDVKLAPNTKLVKVDGDTFAVRYYWTDVVLLHRDGTRTLDSNGWRTASTLDRMNNHGGANVRQQRGNWFVNGTAFKDGMRV